MYISNNRNKALETHKAQSRKVTITKPVFGASRPKLQKVSVNQKTTATISRAGTVLFFCSDTRKRVVASCMIIVVA